MRFRVLTSLLAAGAIGNAACGTVTALAPRATISEVEPSGHAAKPPDCDMPILHHEPLVDFRKVAIIEGEGSLYASESDILPAVKRKACETGADALVILTSRSQTSESMTGYYINSVAIVYGRKNPAAEGAAPQLLH